MVFHAAFAIFVVLNLCLYSFYIHSTLLAFVILVSLVVRLHGKRCQMALRGQIYMPPQTQYRKYYKNYSLSYIYRVFFSHWYHPKKLKYGKPRLGESTLT